MRALKIVDVPRREHSEKKSTATVRSFCVCGATMLSAGGIQSARKSDKKLSLTFFTTRQRWQFLPSSQAISAILTMSQLPKREGVDAEVVHAKAKEVRDRGRMREYRTSLCESFLMCDHVTFKVWNKDTKRWEL